MKVTDVIKEKAMMKLKEIKSKTEDSGSKARQYLDGLLKIPFSIFRKEPIMNLMDENRQKMQILTKVKTNITNIEIKQITKTIKNTQKINTLNEINAKSKKELMLIVKNINPNYKFDKKTKQDLILEITENIDAAIKVDENIQTIETNFSYIKDYMVNVKDTLDEAVYGHDNAKKQIERIIGQWINGEQDGYCFGFEGPPGVGKTSLAKRGLSKCLIDENGESRPFSMIQMGGDANGSTLHGHNYTYVGSTWGGIVQILIDKKCMNPIILIDELDKISKTEHGREIIGILTHLLDPTQNDCFQDKYFSGIDLDLSKALFILSYNDVESIDKILLDRIHRIKFSNLSLEDKLIIANKHILPEIYKKIGLQDIIEINEETLIFIIEEYTCEPGVRKLKEILFEIIAEINLDVLKNDSNYDFPIQITITDIKTKYLKDNSYIKIKKINSTSEIGIIHGLWANAMGKGGIIPIQSHFFPCDAFLNLKLTGMQGDVMKESMNVALTLAWNLTDHENHELIRNKYQEHKYGIHIHCPEGATPKDGPSAGAAITCVIYSILNNKKIKYNFAMTGEISLDGYITEIGGLDLKFLGGIKAGVTEFIYPEENEKDYISFIKKYEKTELIKNIIFHKVTHIKEVFELIFE